MNMEKEIKERLKLFRRYFDERKTKDEDLRSRAEEENVKKEIKEEPTCAEEEEEKKKIKKEKSEDYISTEMKKERPEVSKETASLSKPKPPKSREITKTSKGEIQIRFYNPEARPRRKRRRQETEDNNDVIFICEYRP